MTKYWLTMCLTLTLVLTGHYANAENVVFEGQVVKVSDGDTLSVTAKGKTFKIRLAGIDAPEKDQGYGLKSSTYLKRLVQNRQVKLSVTGQDQYGRLIASIWLNNKNINLTMVRTGHAWVYRRYTTSTSLIKAENKARSEGTGLWYASDPTPPWEWRARNK